jgi:hypothetical protein
MDQHWLKPFRSKYFVPVVLWHEYSCAFVDFSQSVYAHWLQICWSVRFLQLKGWNEQFTLSGFAAFSCDFVIAYCKPLHSSWLKFLSDFFICGSKFSWCHLLWFDLDIINKQLQIVYVLIGLCNETFNYTYSYSQLILFTCIYREAIGKILARGHSRVPVYSGNPRNVIGLLLVG